MTKPNTGDVVHINMGLVYNGYKQEYDAIVLWNSFNGQPLLTRTGEYKPFWGSYNEIESIIGHIDMKLAVKWE